MIIQRWIDGWCLVIPLYQEIGCQRGVASDNQHLVSLVLAVVCKTCWRLCWGLKKDVVTQNASAYYIPTWKGRSIAAKSPKPSIEWQLPDNLLMEPNAFYKQICFGAPSVPKTPHQRLLRCCQTPRWVLAFSDPAHKSRWAGIMETLQCMFRSVPWRPIANIHANHFSNDLSLTIGVSPEEAPKPQQKW